MRTSRFLWLAFLILAIPAALFAQFGVSVTIAPPALPVYEQPIAPAAGYLWTPGYWANGDEGYFWVPGTWVMPPEAGLLWTPGYWGWGGDAFAWNGGYWGTQVGFYGGVNYGFGYGGVGYGGGYWNNGAFFYNRSVNNVTNITNVYSKTVINTTTYNHVSYNGGTGGVNARPNAAEETASHERHTAPTSMQTEHVHAASTNHALLASVNRGRPAIAATAKPGEFSGKGVVQAKQAGAPYKATESKASENKAAENKASENKAAATRANDNKATENKAPATRANENKATENKAAATRTNENKASENKAAAPRPTENKATENKAQNKAAKPNVPRTPPESKPTAARPQPTAKPATTARTQPAAKPATTARAQPAPRPAKEAPKTEERPRQ
jgi:hypothetical protein